MVDRNFRNGIDGAYDEPETRFASDEAISALRQKLTGERVSPRPAAPRQTIDTYLDELGMQLSQLDEMVAYLVQRINPVLGDQKGLDNTEAPQEDRYEGSQLAVRLQDNISFVKRLQYDIARTSERVEL